MAVEESGVIYRSFGVVIDGKGLCGEGLATGSAPEPGDEAEGTGGIETEGGEPTRRRFA